MYIHSDGQLKLYLSSERRLGIFRVIRTPQIYMLLLLVFLVLYPSPFFLFILLKQIYKLITSPCLRLYLCLYIYKT